MFAGQTRRGIDTLKTLPRSVLRVSMVEPIGIEPKGFAFEHRWRFDLSSSALVEPIGIEPTTSCLQSRRSPN